jgi:hypothetical protein
VNYTQKDKKSFSNSIFSGMVKTKNNISLSFFSQAEKRGCLLKSKNALSKIWKCTS